MTLRKMPTDDLREEEIPDIPEDDRFEFYDTLRLLLNPYQPADSIEESNKQFSTMEIIQALELHYGIPQGNPNAFGIPGEKVVEHMQEMGYKCINTGNLQLEWLLKKK
jgi:hypothetical protein